MSVLRLMSQNQWNYVDNNETWKAMGLDCSAKARMPGHLNILQTLLPDILGDRDFIIPEVKKYMKMMKSGKKTIKK